MLVERANEFDALMSHIADAIESGGDPLIALDDHGIVDAGERQTLKATIAAMQELHAWGRNHIWAYYTRNLVRPVALIPRQGGRDRPATRPGSITTRESMPPSARCARSWSGRARRLSTASDMGPHPDATPPTRTCKPACSSNRAQVPQPDDLPSPRVRATGRRPLSDHGSHRYHARFSKPALQFTGQGIPLNYFWSAPRRRPMASGRQTGHMHVLASQRAEHALDAVAVDALARPPEARLLGVEAATQGWASLLAHDRAGGRAGGRSTTSARARYPRSRQDAPRAPRLPVPLRFRPPGSPPPRPRRGAGAGAWAWTGAPEARAALMVSATSYNPSRGSRPPPGAARLRTHAASIRRDQRGTVTRTNSPMRCLASPSRPPRNGCSGQPQVSLAVRLLSGVREVCTQYS